jgi:hypothetical protein
LAVAVAAVLLVAMAIGATAGSAQIIGPQNPDEPLANSPWQAGTCKSDAGPCSVATPTQFYEKAAGHPRVGFTQFIVNTKPAPLPPFGPAPTGNLRTVRVDLPTGLTVNPQSTPEQCDLAPGESPEKCASKAPASKVGTSEVTATNEATGNSVVLPKADVYNVVPKDGEPARFGLSLLGNDVFLEADIAWEGDYHEYFTIHVTKLSLPTIPILGEVARIAKNRLVFDGTAGDGGTFITTPTTCFGPATPGSIFEHVYSTFLRADSYEETDPSFPDGSAFVESKIPRKPGEFETSPKDCNSIPFDPSLGVGPNTDLTDSPAGPTVTVNLPEVKNPSKDEESQGSSQVRSAKVTLPLGMGINPSAANGLETCTDAQFGKGTRNPVSCPAASRVGTVEVDTPPLPDGSLSGPVFVGQQLSRDPTSGDEYRIFVLVESSRYDISARLLGKISADPQTGQLTTTFDDGPLGSIPVPGLPQVPFKSFRIKLNGGATATLTSPPTCGPNTSTTVMTPWSGNEPATRSNEFSLSAAPGGGQCAKTLAERPFAPSFGAGVNKAQAASYSPLHMNIARSDGNQELKGVDVTLPPGLTAKLAGVRYCPPASLAAAAANSAAAEKATSSCPASSLIGSANVSAGSGPSPIQVSGKVFLTGRYKGAPLSLAVITPAAAGPFDLGTVVVRVALFVDPRTAQVHAVSDPIPHVYGGALLDVRSIAVKIDRKEFSLNPTNCSQFAFAGSLRGGGANPLDPAAFSSFGVSAPFKANGCDSLDFKPKFSLRLFGATRRAKNPRLRAILIPRDGDANMSRAAVTLPRSLFLDQSSIANVCTRVQFAANNCPKDSVYGHAQAFSPLLDGPLEGPVYLRSSDNTLPDLVVDLHGQVDIELDARIDSVHGRIRNTFGLVPDVPVSKFVLTVPGGRKGLLTNSRNLCPRKKSAHGGKASQGQGAHASKKRHKRKKGLRALVRFQAQNGKKANMRTLVRTPCGKRKHHHKHKG